MSKTFFKTCWWLLAVLAGISLLSMLAKIGLAIDDAKSWREFYYLWLPHISDSFSRIVLYGLTCYYIKNEILNKE